MAIRFKESLTSLFLPDILKFALGWGAGRLDSEASTDGQLTADQVSYIRRTETEDEDRMIPTCQSGNLSSWEKINHISKSKIFRPQEDLMEGREEDSDVSKCNFTEVCVPS